MTSRLEYTFVAQDTEIMGAFRGASYADWLKKVNSDLRIRILDYWNTNPGLPKSDRIFDFIQVALKLFFVICISNFFMG